MTDGAGEQCKEKLHDGVLGQLSRADGKINPQTPEQLGGDDSQSNDKTSVEDSLPSKGTQRKTLSRRATRESVPRTSSYQRPTPQLLSSLMAESSSSDEDEDGDGDGDGKSSNSSNSKDFDLHPPALKPKPPSIESLSELLFSAEHLRSLLQNPSQLARFISFMHRYQPKEYAILMRYVENSKAIAAIEYANAIAANACDMGQKDSDANMVAKLDEKFELSHNAAFRTLLSSALPLYITYSLVRVVSECLENEIIGRINPVMRNLVGGLSEVFCLTDPNQEDNPIIFASQEFYRFTGYDRDQVIGHNCRFLQGPRTRRDSPTKIKISLERGEEIHETLLNYRRDGRPFVNLLMLAPLYDNHGKVKYHIGAQVDVTGLVEGGRALDSFRGLLAQRDLELQKEEWAKADVSQEQYPQKQIALNKLKGLSELFDSEEAAVVQSASRHGSGEPRVEQLNLADKLKETANISSSDMEINAQDAVPLPSHQNSFWDLSKIGPRGFSGQLPGIYEKYMLIRPVPSLRIIFASSRLQTWGKVVQNPFMSHIAADRTTLSGLNECFDIGCPVTAQVKFMLERGEHRRGTLLQPDTKDEKVKESKKCWISATPLYGSDDRLGVWMVVFVERMKGSDRTERQGVFGRNISQPEMNEVNRRILRRQSYHRTLSNDVPIKPKRLDGSDIQIASLDSHLQQPNKEQTSATDNGSRPSVHESRRDSPSPTANQSRKASPRQQAVGRRLSSPSQKYNRRRLPSTGDGEQSDDDIRSS